MRRHLTLVLATTAVALVCAATASGVPTTLPLSPLNFTLGADTIPHRLPTGKYAPVGAHVSGKVTMSDGTHPSALREITLDVDKDVKVNAKGLPVCKGGMRAMPDPRAALRICGDTKVGGGTAHAEIAFPGLAPIKVASPLNVFNGGERDGKVTLLIHTVITVPVPAPIVTTVTIQRKGSGIHSVVKVPAIAGGSGSMLDFDFKLGKTYVHKGKKVGYFEARCPDGVFKVNAPKVVFKNEAQVPGVGAQTVLKGGLAVPCTPKG